LPVALLYGHRFLNMPVYCTTLPQADYEESTQQSFEEENDDDGECGFFLDGQKYLTYNEMVTAKRERNHKAPKKVVCKISSFAALDIPPVRQSTPSEDDKDHKDNEEVEDDEDDKDEKDHDDDITSKDNDVHKDNEDDDVNGDDVGDFINEVEVGVPSAPHSLFIKQLHILNQTPTY